MLFIKKLFWTFSCLKDEGVLFLGTAIIFFGSAFYVQVATGHSVWKGIAFGWQYSSILWFLTLLVGVDFEKLKWVWSRKKRKSRKVRKVKRA